MLRAMTDLGAREVEQLLEKHRVELTGYCYRMLGSPFDAEDAVQDTLVRAWRAWARFEGRSSPRSWLYRIATNVCVDMLSARKRRARPMDLGPSSPAHGELGAPLAEGTWVEPVPDGFVVPLASDPAEQLAQRETIRLAFVAALQLLPPKQRAALILREVLHFSAAEIAELLGTTVPSVNSALQRARATLESKGPSEDDRLRADDGEEAQLLARYVEAFERWDVDGLVALLHEDATLSMPPFPMWLRGPEELRRFWLGPAASCAGSRLVRLRANGVTAFAQYKPGQEGRVPWAVHVLEIKRGRIVEHNSFLDTARIFPLFGLPLRENDGNDPADR